MERIEVIHEDAMDIFNHFGFETQKEKLFEESCELFRAPHDKSEMADVFLVAYQLYMNDPEIREIVAQKVERTLQRIREGYYSKRSD